MAVREPLGLNLEQYKSDFQSERGTSFSHFYCPILHVDEDVDLSKGHIIPAALGGRQRVLQRSDVDNGLGSFFEAESAVAFSQTLDRPDLVDRLLTEPDDSAKLRRVKRWLEIEGNQHQIPFGLTRNGGERVLVVSKTDFPLGEKTLEVRLGVELDARSSTLISCLKMSFLHWFKQLGYRYVFSNEGILVAWVLRQVYENFIQPSQRHKKKRGLMSENVKAQVNEFCLQFANIIRPVPSEIVKSWPAELQMGTTESNWFLALVDDGQPYGRVTILRLGSEHCAVLTPTITDARGWALLDIAAHLHLEFTMAKWNADIAQFELAPPSGNSLIWPSVGYPTPPISIREAAEMVQASGRLQNL